MILCLIIFGLSGYTLGVVSIYVNAWALANCASPQSRSRFRPLQFASAGAALAGLIYVPIVLGILAMYHLTNNPERTFLNGAALLMCGIRLASLGAVWSRLIERTACLRLFVGASVLMTLLALCVVWVYGEFWRQVGSYPDGIGQLVAGMGVLLSAPLWVGLYIGIASLPALAASMIAYRLPPAAAASAQRRATTVESPQAVYQFRPVEPEQTVGEEQGPG